WSEAEGHGGRPQALTVVRPHQFLEAVTGRDQHVRRGHEAALEVELPLWNRAQAHHVLAPADGEAGRVALDEQPADALIAHALPKACEDEVEPRGPGAGDVALVPGEQESSVRRLGGTRHVRGG